MDDAWPDTIAPDAKNYKSAIMKTIWEKIWPAAAVALSMLCLLAVAFLGVVGGGIGIR